MKLRRMKRAELASHRHRAHRRLAMLAAALLAVGAAVPGGAQETGAESSETEAESPEAAAQRAKFESIQWVDGPASGRIGTVAQLEVPAGCRYTEAAGARAFLEVTENIPSGHELGALFCEDRSAPDNHWFVIYTYDPSGYVRDDEKEELDADAILASIREGTEAANRVRRERGWTEMSVKGWVRPPYYDESTNNLTWSFTGVSSDAGETVNHSVRLLGRGGVLHADLVLDPSQLGTVVGDFDGVVATTAFVSGQRYAEWREGDKVAAYGLTALVAGGAGAIAAKTGLLAKLGKLLAAAGKVIVVAVIGLVAALKKLFTRKKTTNGSAPASGS